MKYIMRAGALYNQNDMLAQIKGVLVGPEKRIFSADGTLLLQTNIRNLNDPMSKSGNVRFRQYVLTDIEGTECAVAKPDYAKDDDPEAVGWPVCRMPKVDHAQIQMRDNTYFLTMRNDQNYLLENAIGENVVQIFHRGLMGGWDIEANDDFSPEIICGIFVFCKYMEQENEFLVV